MPLNPSDDSPPPDAATTTETEAAERPHRSAGPGPAPDPTLPPLGPIGWLRWAWRSLTTMRTALILLLLLVAATIPGSILPQRTVDPSRVLAYLAAHPTAGPWLDRLGFFHLYSSVWFSAVYLLLMISLTGCILPRTRQYLRTLRSTPPRPPRRLDRLPVFVQFTASLTPAQALTSAREALAPTRRGRTLRWPARAYGYRVHAHTPTTLSAENGRLREAGNLLFHISILVVVLGVAIGHLWQWRADVIVPEGQGFTTTATSLDTLNPGPLVDPGHLPAFALRVNSMAVSFDTTPGSAQLGQPRQFAADVTVSQAGTADRAARITVNHPLGIAGTEVYLLGNGYAPVITVRDARGAILYQDATPFLPQDAAYTSTGVVKVVAATPRQIGLAGFFLPTADPTFSSGPTSLFPATIDPELILTGWTGTLFPGNRPQSVYRLDTSAMTQLTSPDGSPAVARLRPGETYRLPGGLGSVTFDRVVRWAGLSVRHTPAKTLTMAAAISAALGLILSLLVPRRRIFIEVTEHRPEPEGRRGHHGAPATATLPGCTVTLAATATSTDPHLARVLDRLHTHLISTARPSKESAR